MLDRIENFIENNNSFLISTCSYSCTHQTRCSYIQEGTDIYFASVQNSIQIQQIIHNPKIVLIIEDEETSLTYSGIAKIVKTHPNKEKMIKELSKKDKLNPQGIFDIELVKIIPLEINIPKEKISLKFPENKPSIIKELLLSITSSIKIWVKAIRLPFISVSILAVAVGAAAAYYDKSTFSWLYFLLSTVGIFTFHASADLFNDFFDYISGTDDLNIKKTPFSGGSRMIQYKLFTPTRVLTGGIFFLTITIGIGFYLNFSVKGNIILYIGLVGAFLGIFYVGLPFKLAHFGLGEIAIFISFGPAIVFGSYYLHTEVFSWFPIFVSVIIGLLISLILFVNQFPDFEADKKAGKHNWVVRFGKKTSSFIYVAAMSIAYILLILYVILQILPLLSLIILVSLPLPIKASIITLKKHENYLEMIPASATTIFTCLNYSSLLILSLIISTLL
ncbi:MAG: prenyltransferase [Candidatus Thorarchaeota archaeon]